MFSSFQWFFLATLAAGLLCLLNITGPGRGRMKVMALACTALFLPLSYLAVTDLLSRPKPLQLELVQNHLKAAVVTAAILREGKGIYLWLQITGLEEPRAYTLPWNEQLAIQLHRAQQEAEVSGTDVEMTLPSGDTRDTDMPLFKARVAMALPLKMDEQ